MTCRWLVLRLDAPLMSFGGVAIDQVGPVRDFPAASMLTGLIGNAFGWHWSDSAAHQTMQDRLVFAARREREGVLLTDTQNAQIAKADKGWTTYGMPEGRDGASYDAPHRRLRDYQADLSVTVVLRLHRATVRPQRSTLSPKHSIDPPARCFWAASHVCPRARCWRRSRLVGSPARPPMSRFVESQVKAGSSVGYGRWGRDRSRVTV